MDCLLLLSPWRELFWIAVGGLAFSLLALSFALAHEALRPPPRSERYPTYWRRQSRRRGMFAPLLALALLLLLLLLALFGLIGDRGRCGRPDSSSRQEIRVVVMWWRWPPGSWSCPVPAPACPGPQACCPSCARRACPDPPPGPPPCACDDAASADEDEDSAP
jgi:hypothetical protein